MKKQHRSALSTAQLLAINAKLYEQERDRQITRYRFSINTLRKLANRKALRASFLAELEDELEELNWLFVRLGGEFAIISLEKSDSWVKLGYKRLAQGGTRLLNMSEEDIDTTYDDFFPEEDGDEADGNED
ncbi:hypothetical protein [Ralstonia flaminis]|jgi:hypothetical protein|uniref:Uncharacterized protein n=1 Tax=Ralstonia flaminis TaxID=3058597 RepID=A0ABM9KB02_9RALS|nr:hypothetical protein [Ralstonia sp. LMG 18101]CAJ0822429.1 hypothetical protein LMG18101_05001 [Ralstonia sp. LMG 18101]